MMADSQVHFDRRIRRLSRKHDAMSRGYSVSMRPDGLVVVKPRRSRPGIPPKSLFMFFAAFFLFKGFLLANLGAETFEGRIDRLSSGTPVEQAGAWVMQADPLTKFIAAKMGPVLR